VQDDNKWAGFVRAHRLAKNMNQGAFAQLLGVSQQTVSRWESGSQIPEPPMQLKLRSMLSVTALNSLAFWRHRVSNAAGLDVLIASDLTVLAASRRAAGLLADGQDMAGRSFPEFLPRHEMAASDDLRLRSIEQFREIGFFDGLIRSMRLDMEWHVPKGSCACKTDVWPVMTSDQVIVGHFSGTPVPIPEPGDGFQGIRVKNVAIRLNKDDPHD
jgi:transcriptional regulator with XRE-family HTH domain